MKAARRDTRGLVGWVDKLSVPGKESLGGSGSSSPSRGVPSANLVDPSLLVATTDPFQAHDALIGSWDSLPGGNNESSNVQAEPGRVPRKPLTCVGTGVDPR